MSAEPASLPLPGPPWCEADRLADGRVRLRIGGTFDDDEWLSSLCIALTDHDLSIERAHAVRGQGPSWLAEFTLHADDAAEDPSALPYLEWVHSEVSPLKSPVRLRTFQVERVDAHGGTLCLAIEADDEIGLIGALLSRLAELELRPVEVNVATRAGRAEDRFWLSRPDGTAPSDAQYDELVKAFAAEPRPD